MAFNESDMYYKDYEWSAGAGNDNPYYRGGVDWHELNRSEGYEVQYFVEHVTPKIVNSVTVENYQKIERMIRAVPEEIKKREKIEEWLKDNWTTFKF